MRAGLGPAAVLREAVFTGLADDALAAALSIGEVRQQWGVVPDQIGHCVHYCDDRMECTQWFPWVHNKARTVVTWPDGTVITTPWRSDGE